ncbi:N-formylglutamate deformylase [Aquibium sp. A9E412]|uniref:N-formylglutamate deformylase n=1 Tax=Aquibium sp. A9E412 TaxID=2976767 RepID=UPI0025B22362|nr:N-formylglutamate deformylase [Aquibium sp. A9E412]MDN2565916.1 N-formylglutamate deformylase [Aquibium sp. A9E412]
MTPVEVSRGASPVILGLPHTGTHVPDAVRDALNAEGRLLRDTDWHVDRLYDGLLPEATTVRATFHRYVIDANRDPTGKSLYPGQNTTGLVPVTDFDNRPIWRDGAMPDRAETARRLTAFHQPYHAALADEIMRVRERHGVAVVYDCHSIRSRCPFLFDGRLPDFNIGSDGGRSCAPEIEAAVAEICAAAPGHSSVVNGRFRGGWTTRHYGNPAENVHAIQMELAQATHLATEAPPFAYDADKAGRLRGHLKTILTRIEAIALSMKPGASR